MVTSQTPKVLNVRNTSVASLTPHIEIPEGRVTIRVENQVRQAILGALMLEFHKESH